VPRAGVEPARDIVPRDFKSLASTSSATQAEDGEDSTGASGYCGRRNDLWRDCILGPMACKGEARVPQILREVVVEEDEGGSDLLGCGPHLRSGTLDGGDDLAVLEDAHRPR
jgi:hypothetical protein